MIATTIEQSKHLIERGVDINTADMYYSHDYNIDEYEDDAQIITQSELGQHFSLFPEDTPAWSLTALLDFIPDMELAKFTKDEKPWYFIGVPHHQEDAETAIEAAYKMVCWLKE